MNRKLVPMLSFIAISTALCAVNEQKNDSLLSIERIYSTDQFKPEEYGPIHWLKTKTGYTVLENSDIDSTFRDIVRYDPATGKREILVPANRLFPPDSSAPLTISDYAFSEDGRRLLIFTNTRRVWRENTRGDYWDLDLKTWKLHKLGGGAAPSTLMFAAYAPDGRKVAYVREKNIYVQDLHSNEIKALTNDRGKNIINGTFDWVYEEEFFLRDGFQWSPDGKWIAYWQLDTEGVGTYFMINNTDSLYPKIIPVQYPKTGTTNPACRIGVVSAGGGPTRWMQVPGDPRNNYIAHMEWIENPQEIAIQRLNRLQNTNHLMICDPNTGTVRTVFADRDSAWIEVMGKTYWLNKYRDFLWLSERDGWQHVYKIPRSGEDICLLTKAPYDVGAIENVDDQHGWLYYSASPENAAQRYLYRIRLDGLGESERISPADKPGTHQYNISDDGLWAVHTYSSFGVPPTVSLVSLPDHKTKRILVKNTRIKENISRLEKSASRFFRIDIGEGVELDGWEIRPPDFDPQKTYPVLFYVYGEPWHQTVLDLWGGNRYLWHLMLTQQGFVVMSIDNRGTPALRGRTWRKCVYGQIGILASADQAAAVRRIREWSYIDSTRVAIWGWSGGGSMSLNAIFRYPDLYQTAMSVAFVSNQRYYDTIYQERYMRLPDENPEGYINGSPITFAHRLKGNLLIVHGTGDDNVHYQNAEALINELIKHDKTFTMMSYPNRSHGIKEGENTTLHLFKLLTRYLKEHTF